MSTSGSPKPTAPKATRISQRQPTACAECSRRKVRCDKQIPCARCIRLDKSCSREVVRTTKSISANREELLFLHNLKDFLPDIEDVNDIRREVLNRINFLEYGQHPSPASDKATSPTPSSNALPLLEKPDLYPEQTPPRSIPTMSDSSAVLESGVLRGSAHNFAAKKVATFKSLEALAWGKTTGNCYPHRRCNCSSHRKYSELASINCDLSSPFLRWVPANVGQSVLLPVVDSRRLIKFHMDFMWWHHNTFHSLTFLDQCEIFWTSGTIVHPLWMAVYLAVNSTTLFALANSPRQREQLGVEFPDAIIDRQYRAMRTILYQEDFIETPSIFSIQAITLTSRVAHNLGYSRGMGSLIPIAYGIARALGLHNIQSPHSSEQHNTSNADVLQPAPTWFEAVELEVGKRTWWQLVVQDHFNIPSSETYIIQPSQFTTDLPMNCNDDDMVDQPEDLPTSSSYTRIIAREATRMPHVLDGLGPLKARKSMAERYQHILKCDSELRNIFLNMPTYLLREPGHGDPLNAPSVYSLPWIPIARRTMAISAAEKIIATHRPILFYAFLEPESPFSATRVTCTSAAVTILLEYECATSEGTLSIWTQSAFCIAAIMVLGLNLLYRPSHATDVIDEYRGLLMRAADRLRNRRVDTLAAAGCKLVDVILSIEEELGINHIQRTGGRNGGGLEWKQREAVDKMVMSQEILARFLGLNVGFHMPEWPWTTLPLLCSPTGPGTPVPMAGLLQPVNVGLQDALPVDFNGWFDQVFGAGHTFDFGSG